jgi:hypothetical protein
LTSVLLEELILPFGLKLVGDQQRGKINVIVEYNPIEGYQELLNQTGYLKESLLTGKLIRLSLQCL